MSKVVVQFQNVKNDSDIVIIEGVQALKHAMRFGAEVEDIITCDIAELHRLISELAPDISRVVSKKITEVSSDEFQKISPKNHRTKVVSLARRKSYRLENIAKEKPIIFLEDPKDLENIGAVIRVAAAADSGAVVTDAQASVWHPGVIRGAAGLQFALPVMNLSLANLKAAFPQKKIVTLDPGGVKISDVKIPCDGIYIFGTERSGITKETLVLADVNIRLPMKEGVSSLNLATSVAATLYGGGEAFNRS